jgi:hypothetical protein
VDSRERKPKRTSHLLSFALNAPVFGDCLCLVAHRDNTATEHNGAGQIARPGPPSRRRQRRRLRPYQSRRRPPPNARHQRRRRPQNPSQPPPDPLTILKTTPVHIIRNPPEGRGQQARFCPCREAGRDYLPGPNVTCRKRNEGLCGAGLGGVCENILASVWQPQSGTKWSFGDGGLG